MTSTRPQRHDAGPLLLAGLALAGLVACGERQDGPGGNRHGRGPEGTDLGGGLTLSQDGAVQGGTPPHPLALPDDDEAAEAAEAAEAGGTPAASATASAARCCGSGPGPRRAPVER